MKPAVVDDYSFLFSRHGLLFLPMLVHEPENAPDHPDATADAPLFTVVMPVYNHAEYLAEAVRSVLDQTYSSWELIVVDDGSTDDSPRLAETFAEKDGRILVLRQANAGPAAARNTALRRARGEWIAFLDSDDVWYADTLGGYARAVEMHPEAAFFYGYRDRLTSDGTVEKRSGEFQDAPSGTKELFGRMFLSTMVSCFRKSLLESVGGFDETLRSCEDYELFLRMSLQTSFVPLGNSTGLRRRHGGNISRQTGFSRFQEAEILRRFVERKVSRDVIGADLFARRMGRLYYTSGRQYFKSRCMRQAAAALSESLRYRPAARSFLLKLLCTLLRPLGREDERALPRLG